MEELFKSGWAQAGFAFLIIALLVTAVITLWRQWRSDDQHWRNESAKNALTVSKAIENNTVAMKAVERRIERFEATIAERLSRMEALLGVNQR